MFSKEEADFQYIDYCIAKANFHRNYDAYEELKTDLRWLEEHHYQIDYKYGKGFSHIYNQFDELFFFPGYAHKNLNSMIDVLRDIEIYGKGLVLVLRNIEQNSPLVSSLVQIAFEQFLIGKRLLLCIS